MTIISDDPVWWPTISFCRFYNHFLAACTTVVIYDWALSFGQEFELILSKRWTFMTVLYICVRYIGILYCVVNVLLFFPGIWISDTGCTIVWYIQVWSPVIVNAMLGVIMIARINAMYHGSKKVFIFLVAALLACTIASAVIMVIANLGVSAQQAVLSGYDTCMTNIDTYMMHLIYESVIPTTIWEILALFLTIWVIIKYFREQKQLLTKGNCFTILVESHVFYFLAFVAMTSFTLGSVSPGITYSPPYTKRVMYYAALATAQMLQMFVLGPRLILSVRESYAKSVARAEGGSDMTSMTFDDVFTGKDTLNGGDV
jgi:hypothetical protein